MDSWVNAETRNRKHKNGIQSINQIHSDQVKHLETGSCKFPLTFLLSATSAPKETTFQIKTKPLLPEEMGKQSQATQAEAPQSERRLVTERKT